MEVTVQRHCVPSDPQSGLSPLQSALLESPQRVRVVSAPTGAGKSYAFLQALLQKDEHVLFVVPTRRLAQNLALGTMAALIASGLSEKKAQSKVALWSSEQTLELKAAGVQNVRAHRLREFLGEESKIIYTVPEIFSRLLLRRLDAGLSAVGILDFLEVFDHVVFDEFHTIEARGFGLAALCAVLSAKLPGLRSRVSFLSATPLELHPVLSQLGIPEDSILFQAESVENEGRPLHGDVRLLLEESERLIDLLETHLAEIRSFVERGRQVVLIYDKLHDFKQQQPEFKRLAEKMGLRPQDVLLVNSIDDSSIRPDTPEGFACGSKRNPDDFSLIVATSSVEMGVTLRAADVLLMEPGHAPLNFLQRYGRAARRDTDGMVLVRLDTQTQRQAWLRRLRDWVEERNGQTAGIRKLTEVLAQDLRRQHSDQTQRAEALDFGAMPRRAVYCAALYWCAVMDHKSTNVHRRKWLKESQPPAVRHIRGWLYGFRALEEDSFFKHAAKAWREGFEKQAFTLRDIGKSVYVSENGGNRRRVSETWLERYTSIPARFPATLNEKDDTCFELPHGVLEDYRLDKPVYERRPVMVLFPFEQGAFPLDDRQPVRQWLRIMEGAQEGGGLGRKVWRKHPEAMEAALKLTRTTGLLVTDDEEFSLGACHGVL